jgi:hypothetical protein
MAKKPVRITKKAARNIGRDLAKRAAGMQATLAQEISSNIADHVRQKIPTGGWYDIYKDAIRFFVNEDATRFAVSGFWPVQFSTYPAKTTLVIIDSDVLGDGNPWPIDQIPAVSGGLRVNAVARPASEGDVEKRREQLIPRREEFAEALRKAGAQVLEDEFPVISGTIFADIVYMALALEHGLAGLKRVPHWISAYRAALSNAKAWSEAASGRAQAILSGEAVFTQGAEKMPSELKAFLGRR